MENPALDCDFSFNFWLQITHAACLYPSNLKKSVLGFALLRLIFPLRFLKQKELFAESEDKNRSENHIPKQAFSSQKGIFQESHLYTLRSRAARSSTDILKSEEYKIKYRFSGQLLKAWRRYFLMFIYQKFNRGNFIKYNYFLLNKKII